MFEGRFKTLTSSSMKVMNTAMSVSLSYKWNLGSMLGFVLISQIFTGLFLVMFYVSDSSVSFLSVEYIMREVGSGWWIRILHFNGASLFFVCIYIHVARGLLFGSFRLWKVWSTGMVLFFLVMGEALLGYVLPWGQMSVWGACVITSLLSVLPWAGEVVVVWVWGGFVVNSATLGCFLMLHYLLPLVMLAAVVLHVLFLHESGSTTRSGASDGEFKIKFFPYLILKDLMDVCLFSLLLFFCSVFPFLLGDCENLKEANLMSSPIHIQPEWYFLFVYAILRAVPNKLGGVIAMCGALVLVWAFCLCSSGEQSSWGGSYKMIMMWFFIFTGVLTLLGASPVEVPLVSMSQILTSWYFLTLLSAIALFSTAW